MRGIFSCPLGLAAKTVRPSPDDAEVLHCSKVRAPPPVLQNKNQKHKTCAQKENITHEATLRVPIDESQAASISHVHYLSILHQTQVDKSSKQKQIHPHPLGTVRKHVINLKELIEVSITWNVAQIAFHGSLIKQTEASLPPYRETNKEPQDSTAMFIQIQWNLRQVVSHVSFDLQLDNMFSILSQSCNCDRVGLKERDTTR